MYASSSGISFCTLPTKYTHTNNKHLSFICMTLCYFHYSFQLFKRIIIMAVIQQQQQQKMTYIIIIVVHTQLDDQNKRISKNLN